MPKGLLSIVVGNTPAARGLVVDQLVRAAPRAVVLSASIHCRNSGYPVVQRFVTGTGVPHPMPRAATGNPAVILRQDLLAIRRSVQTPHIVLALADDLDLLPFLVELWRPRIGASALGDYYAPAPVLAGIDPTVFLAELGCVHRAARLWDGADRTDPLTQAEIAARRVEAVGGLIVTTSPNPADIRAGGVAVLARHLNPSATLVNASCQPGPGLELPPSFLRPTPDAAEEWQSRMEAVTTSHSRLVTDQGVSSVVWQTRRPLHPERLADALPTVMAGVVRSRGHLWLSSKPEAVLTWRSAGAHLELREADRWLESETESAWRTASPQRRTMASWFWHDYYGERRNDLTFTGTDLDPDRLCSALDAALLNDTELSLGSDGWADFPDPLLGDLPR
ncbi:GTP-binding protein [Streptomyces sp. NEAU-S7GS2]|uniref:GTP-binding protein n=1 Tax=Streptomyces sp. NEAU-S7GS2 TaxID=2202000 RepID=UPI001EF41A93|nr:GTP-binding protein [Streptomyces sp. NEAU-S7GS2]